MKSRFRNLICVFTLSALCIYAADSRGSVKSEAHVLTAKAALSAMHAVVTRTIVIDHAPFPDVAGSVGDALIGEGETVDLALDQSAVPCSKINSGRSFRVSLPEIHIVAEKKVVCEGETVSLSASGATSYSWSTGQRSASIEISPSVTTTYFVIGANKEGCVNSAFFIQRVEECQGSVTRLNMDVLPNPSTGYFLVKVQSIGTGLSLQIYNDFGKLVREEKVDSAALGIDLTSEPDGMYLLRLLEQGKEVQRKRLFKTK